MIRPIPRILIVMAMTVSCAVTVTSDAWAQTRETVTIRGHTQSLRRVRHPRWDPHHRFERGWRLDASGAARS